MAKYHAELSAAMARYNINTPKRQAAFLAQIAHESGKLKYWQELADGKAYNGRKDLGNTSPGDGPKYKGRGPIQLTGRTNYIAAGKALGIDLVTSPEIAAHPDVGCLVAGWFWETHGLNPLADTGKFDDITRRINGGYNGKQQRDEFHGVFKAILGVT